MTAEGNRGYYSPKEDDVAIAVNTSVYAHSDSAFPLHEDRPAVGGCDLPKDVRLLFK